MNPFLGDVMTRWLLPQEQADLDSSILYRSVKFMGDYDCSKIKKLLKITAKRKEALPSFYSFYCC